MEVGYLNSKADKQQTAFLLLKPDIFIRNLLPELLKLLYQEGFKILDYKCGNVDESFYDLMYSNQFFWSQDDWYHNRKAYKFGPAMGLLLAYFETKDIFLFLNEIKGHALPMQRKPNSFRSLLRSRSRTFNILHVADEAKQSIQEAQNWFSPSFLSVIKKNPTIKFYQHEEITKDVQIQGYRLEAYLDPEFSYLKSKLRLFHSISKTFPFSMQLKELFKEIQQFYHKWTLNLSDAFECAEIEGTMLPEWENEELTLLNRIKKVISSDNQEYQNIIFQVLEFLIASFDQVLSFKINNYFWVLEKWKVYISELEKYLITSRLKYKNSTNIRTKKKF